MVNNNDCLSTFLSYGPLWLVCFLTLSAWANEYKFCWLSLMYPVDTQPGIIIPLGAYVWYIGLFLMVISALVKVIWVVAWIQALVMTWFCDEDWRPTENATNKIIMQADARLWIFATPDGDVPYHEGHLPRECPFDCPVDPSDRVYHCHRFGRCLPVYDHFCPYIQATVYLRTMKPYCFILVFLPLDAVLSFIVSIIAAGMQSTSFNVPFAASVASSCVVIFLILLANSPENLQRLVWRGQVVPEIREDAEGQKKWSIAFKYMDGGEWKLRLVPFDRNNYWDLGPFENFRQVFGQHWWQWPFSFWTPQRVANYGRYEHGDLPFANFVRQEYGDFIAQRLQRFVTDSLAIPTAPSNTLGSPLARVQANSQISGHIRRRTQGHSNSHGT
ncbi:hypothetical protein AAE478_009423 [Parahypoxylon ruwenzoriense]